MFFYLKEPKATKQTPIIIQYNVKSEKKIFKYATGEKIEPENWDSNIRLPVKKRGNSGTKLHKITTQLMRYDDFLMKLIDHCEINNKIVTREFLKNEFDKHFKNKKSIENHRHIYLTDFIDDFIEKAPTLTNRITKRKYDNVKIKHYKKSYNRLIEFEKHSKKRLEIENVKLPDYDKLVDFLTITKKYSINTAGDHIKNLKVFLNKAKEYNYNIHHDITKFTTLTEKTKAVYLNEEEIQILLEHDFSDNLRLQNCRDLAIIGLWTGLRVSDFLNLPDIDPKNDFIEVQPKKTAKTSGIKVVIPLHHQIKEVINKRGMPHRISDVKFNKYIKEICKIVGFDEEIEGSLKVKNDSGDWRKQSGLYPKHKLISSHTCRRSFATNLYKMNFPTLSIMQITGHTTEKSFLTYIKVTPEEHAQKLLRYWKEYYEEKNKASEK
ncbi:tyrosine-type recombinase/integrase [Tenacibaculum sp. SSH1-16]|uniref:tyrosine-type recombinase/integrase n=1 Tax=Tenacibaculum sp. SSH1-16 TaxID=3136667 RepID=UPI0032C3F95A